MVLIFCAPSGSGKSTIVNYLLNKYPELEFSVSATSRAPRGTEKHGEAYYFLSTEEFQQKIKEVDPRAFVVVTDAYDTFGEGFKAFPDNDEIKAE